MYYKEDLDKNYDKRVKEWDAIEELVTVYKKQFEDSKFKDESEEAAKELLARFDPLLKKYFNLLKFGHVNWKDIETRYFLSMFIESDELKRKCRQYASKTEYRIAILSFFNFAKESFSSIDEEEIINDLNIRLLTLAKRYKQVGRNFCGYVYGCYKFEIYRFIKSRLSNPLNMEYKIISWNETFNDEECVRYYSETFENEDEKEIPASTWISGETCSDIFKGIKPIDRQILIKYYLEEWKDKQIADEFGMHINTVNQRRRNAAKAIAKECGIDIANIKRTRKSGKKAVLPNE